MMIDLRTEALTCKQKDDLRGMNLEIEKMSKEKRSLSFALSFGIVFSFVVQECCWDLRGGCYH